MSDTTLPSPSSLDTPAFVQDYRPGAVHYGRGCTDDLGAALADRGLERALVVTGRNVGANDAVMDPVEAGLGDRLAGVFDRTTPEKRLETVYEGVASARAVDADALVAVGAGSSLDVGRFMRLVAADGRPQEQLVAEIEREGTPTVPEVDLPLFVVPTTLSGADLSIAAAVTYPADGGRAETIPVDDELMPTGLFYDPALFETTPADVLAGSAMNGFDKALECVYSAFATPVTDGTATRALRYLGASLPALRDGDPAVVDRAVAGILAQYGVSRPAYRLSVVHAFGHSLRNEFGVQQGLAHAVVVPHVLELLFDRVDGRRALLAEGLTGGQPEDPATAVVDAVTEIRDGLGLPARLRDLEGVERDGLQRAARLTHRDGFMGNGPEGFDPTAADLLGVLEAAW